MKGKTRQAGYKSWEPLGEGDGEDEKRKLGFQEIGQVQQCRLVSLEEPEGVFQGASEKPRVCRKQAQAFGQYSEKDKEKEKLCFSE